MPKGTLRIFRHGRRPKARPKNRGHDLGRCPATGRFDGVTIDTRNGQGQLFVW